MFHDRKLDSNEIFLSTLKTEKLNLKKKNHFILFALNPYLNKNIIHFLQIFIALPSSNKNSKKKVIKKDKHVLYLLFVLI